MLMSTAWELRMHRGISHSILLTLLVSWLLAKPLAKKRWKKDKVSAKQAGIFVFLASGSHLLIDVFTVYGTRIFDPFSGYPVSTDNLFIIDPVFTIPLLVAVVIGCFVQPKEWKKGKGIRSAWWCLGISALYVGLSFWAKHTVHRAVEADLSRRGITWQRQMEGPSPFNILLWRVLVERPDEIWICYRSVFDPPSANPRWTVVPKGEAALGRYADEWEVKVVKEFSKGWWIAREAPGGLWLVDLRFGEMRAWDERGLALRPRFAWTFEAGAARERLKERKPDDSRGAAETLRRMVRRIGGETDALDAPDGETLVRLIGNPGNLQEYLSRQK
jgi:inner membrane protein